MEAIIETLKQQARASWPGATGEERAVRLEVFLRKMLAGYSAVLGVDQRELLEQLERRRNYSAVNYYQEANFPALDGVHVFEDLQEFRERFPSGKYRCPACGGISNSPYECDTGMKIGSGQKAEVCDWKSYGLFRTLGKGMRIAFRKDFLQHPLVEEIFLPLEAEDGLLGKAA